MKIIPGTDGKYGATEDGTVYSLNYRNKGIVVPLKHILTSLGYLKVTLFLNGTSKLYLVHRLVAKAFIPNPDNLEEVDHIDCNTLNNHVSNLQWVSRTQHVAKTRQDVLNGAKSNRFKLTNDQIRDLRLDYAAGMPIKEMAIKYGIAAVNVSRIATGKRYPNIHPELICEPRNKQSRRSVNKYEVHAMHQLARAGYSRKWIAAQFNLPYTTVKETLNGLTSRKIWLQYQ
jgi:hypothetical protein